MFTSSDQVNPQQIKKFVTVLKNNFDKTVDVDKTSDSLNEKISDLDKLPSPWWIPSEKKRVVIKKNSL